MKNIFLLFLVIPCLYTTGNASQSSLTTQEEEMFAGTALLGLALYNKSHQVNHIEPSTLSNIVFYEDEPGLTNQTFQLEKPQKSPEKYADRWAATLQKIKEEMAAKNKNIQIKNLTDDDAWNYAVQQAQNK